MIQAILFPSIVVSKQKLAAKLTKKTVLITGASYGVGEQLAYILAEYEVHLILVARSSDKLQMLESQLSNKTARTSIYAADLSKQSELKIFIDSLLVLPDGLDIIVSNAGRSILRSVKNSMNRTHDYDRCMAINYFAPVRLISGLLPLLIKSKGHIVNVSAINLLIPPVANWSAYQSSKAAFDQWLQSAAAELNSDGIFCSSLYFPLIKTRMIAPTRSYDNAAAMSADRAALIIARILYKKRSCYAPWWLYIIKPFLHIFKRQWQAVAMRYFKQKHD